MSLCSWVRFAAVAVTVAGVLPAAAAGQGAAGPALAWSPTTSSGAYDYGTLDAGLRRSMSVAFTLTNSGGRASGALMLTMSGPAVFTTTGDGCTGRSLGPRKSCSVSVRYAPTASSESDSATLTATGVHASADIALIGKSGTPDLSLSPGTLTGSAPDGSKFYDYDNGLVTGDWNTTFTITNSGTGTSNRLSMPHCCSDGFFVIGISCDGATVVANGGTCTFAMRFILAFGPPCDPSFGLRTSLDVMAMDDGAPYIRLEAHGLCLPSG